MKKSAKVFITLIKNNLLTLLSFEFLFRFTIAIVIIPQLIDILNYILNKAGIMYITGSNIYDVIKNPLVIAVAVILLLIILCISIYEINCLAACYEYSITGKRIKLYEMFTCGYARMHIMLSGNAAFVARWMLLALPGFNIHFILISVNRVYVLDRLFKSLLKYRIAKLIFPIIILLSFSVIAAGILKFGKKVFGFETNVKNNKSASFSEIIRCLFSCIVINAVITVLLLILYLAAVLTGTLCLKIFTSPALALVKLMKFENILYWVTAFFAGALGITFNTALIYSFNAQKVRVSDNTYARSGSKRFSGRIFRSTVSVLVLVVMIFDVFTIFNFVKNGSHFVEDILKSTTVTAHRGGANFAPENTMDAVNYAIASGADYIEIDVQLTADDVIIVLHDDNLKRTTGINGYPYKMKYSDIKELDAGSYFSSDFSDAYIPTFEEVLSACKGKININIELKKTGSFQNKLPDGVMKLIHDYQMEQQCVITSTTYSYLRYIKKVMPELRTGFIANMLVCDPKSMEYADFFSLKYSSVNQNFVRQAHEAGKEVHVWTVNSRLLINRMNAIDVDSIITDNPILCKKIIAQKTSGKKFIDMLQTILKK